MVEVNVGEQKEYAADDLSESDIALLMWLVLIGRSG